MVCVAHMGYMKGIAQTCVPNTPVTVGAPAQSGALSALITQQGSAALKDFSEWESMRNNLSNCNGSTGKKLREIEDNMSQLSLQRQDLLAVKDVSNLQKQLADLARSRDDSREELKKNLAQVKTAGLYIAIVGNINPLTPKPELIHIAENAIAPQAARDLGGTYIQRETRVSNLSSVSDVIRSFSSGSMVIGEILKDQAMNASKLFVYAAKVYVSPAKTLPQLSGTAAENGQVKIIAISSTNTPEMALSGTGLPQSVIDDLTSILSAKMAAIDSENAAATRKAREVAAAGESKVGAILQQISGIEAQIGTAKNKVKEVLNQLGYPFNGDDLSGSITNAVNGISARANELAKQWLDVKAKELLWKESSVLPEGAPADAIGKTASDLAIQLDKTYGRITTSAEVMEIINLSVSGYQEGRNVDVVRNLERVWVIAIPQDDNTFRVVTVGKFSVNSKILGSNTVSSTPTPPQNTSQTTPPPVEKPLSLTQVKAEIQQGETYYFAQQYAQAFPLLYKHRQHLAFNAINQRQLGYMYDMGSGVKQDYAEAATWYRKAADAGDAWAQNNLAVLYENGRGVQQNYASAIWWYQTAVEQGNSYAQANLAVIYEQGKGIKADKTEAVRLYRMAARQGNDFAQKALQRLGYSW